MADETNTVLKHFQIFRNKKIETYSTYAAALTAAKAGWTPTFVTNKGLKDGEFVLFNYNLGTAKKVESILGIVRSGAIDIIGSYDQLTTEYKAYVDSAINALDADKSGSNTNGDITVQVVETDGKITEVKVSDTLKSVAHTGAAADVAVATGIVGLDATNVQGALAELQGDIAALQAIDPIVTTVAAGTGISVIQSATIENGNDVTYTVAADFTVDTKKYGEDAGDKAGKTYIRIMDGETVISETNAAAFVKDGFLQEVELIEASEGQENVLRFTWNSDAGVQVTDIKVSELCDVYTADETYLRLNGFKFEHKTSGVTVGTYANNTDNVTVDSTTEKSFKVPTLTVDAAGHVTAASEKTVTIKLPATIDTAIQGGAGVNTTYIQTTVDRNSTNTNQLDVTSTAVIGDYAAEGQKDGLATTTTTKAYVDGKIATVNTAIEALDVNPFSLTTLNSDKLEGYEISEVNGKIVKGQTANTLLTFVSAPTASNKVATQAEIAALDADVTSTTGTNVQVQVTEVDGKITAVKVTDNTINATNLSNAINALDVTGVSVATENNGVVSINDVKQVDGKIAKGDNTLVTFKRVATTGAAADVTVENTGNLITANTVEGALVEIAKEIDNMDLAATDVVALNEGKTALQAGKISETDGKVAVGTAATLVEFNQAISSSNKVATMADITNAAVTGQDAIKVENKVVSLTIDSTDKVLSQGGAGLLANVALSYGEEADGKKYIKLTGKNGADLGKIDASDFIKDGFLESVTENEDNNTLTFKWNTDAGVTETTIDIKDLCDVYTAKEGDWIQLNGFEFSHKTQSAFTQVEGQEVPQTTFGANADDVTADAAGESVEFKVPTLTVDAAGHVTAASEKTVTIALPASIDTAVQTVTAAQTEVLSNTKFVAVNATRAQDSNEVVLTTVYRTQVLETAAEGTDGLATASDVKTYVDTKVGAANTAITNAIAELDATVSNIALEDGATTNDIRVEVVETDGVITAVNVTDKLAKVAHSGAAADMSIADTDNKFKATTVEGALLELVSVDTWDAGTY